MSPKNGLNPTAVRNTKPCCKTKRLWDSRGLYLEISPAGGKWWRLKYRYHGKENTLSCGVYPAVSLKEARAERDRLRRLLAQGIDPSVQRKAERAEQARRQAEQALAARFCLDNDGALSVRLPHRRFALTPKETADLRTFLDATKAVACKEDSPCH